MAMFLSRLLIAELRVDQINAFKKQFQLTDEQIKVCNDADPSPKGTYSRWLCQVYTQTKGKDPVKLKAVQDLTEPLKKYMKLCNNPDFPKDKKDIGQFTPDTLLKLVGNERRYLRNLSPSAIEKLLKSEGLPGAKIIWNGGGFKMYYVTNADYAMILGSNTGWCTAANENYASQYSLKGGLYITYYNGKPFLQGHSAASDTDLLDVKDQQPDLLDPTMLLWFKTVQHPIMAVFRRLCDSRFEQFLNHRIRPAAAKTKNKQAIIDYAMESDNLGVVLAIASAGIWWPEGWELLMDSPNYLKSALEHCGTPIIKKLKKESFAKDMAQMCIDANMISQALILAPGEELIDDIVKSIITGKATHFNKDGLDKKTIEAIDETGVKAINELKSGISDDGNITTLGPKSTFAYWKKFINKYWLGGEHILSANSEYVKRCNDLKAIKRLLKIEVGKEVVPGPDCKTSFSKGTVASINGEKITVTTKEGDKQFIQDNDHGIYELQAVGTGMKYVLSVEPKKSFKKGDVVLPGSNFIGREGIGDFGTIVQVTGGTRCKIEWEEGRTDEFYLPDSSYALPAVDYKSPHAVTNYEAADKPSPWKDYKHGEIVKIKTGFGVIGSVDPSDRSVLVRPLDPKSGDSTRWYYPGNEEEQKQFPIFKIKRRPETWHIAPVQPDTLEVGMWVHRGPDWRQHDWGNQDIQDMPNAPDPTKEIVPGQVLGTGEDGWWNVRWPKNENCYLYSENIRGLEVIEKY